MTESKSLNSVLEPDQANAAQVPAEQSRINTQWGVDYKGEPIPADAVPKEKSKPKKIDWEKEKRRRKYPREWPRGEGQP